jgi:hypothetical protein
VVFLDILPAKDVRHRVDGRHYEAVFVGIAARAFALADILDQPLGHELLQGALDGPGVDLRVPRKLGNGRVDVAAIVAAYAGHGQQDDPAGGAAASLSTDQPPDLVTH